MPGCTARNMEAAAERFGQALSMRPDHSIAQLLHAEFLALGGPGVRHAMPPNRRCRDWC